MLPVYHATCALYNIIMRLFKKMKLMHVNFVLLVWKCSAQVIYWDAIVILTIYASWLD